MRYIIRQGKKYFEVEFSSQSGIFVSKKKLKERLRKKANQFTVEGHSFSTPASALEIALKKVEDIARKKKMGYLLVSKFNTDNVCIDKRKKLYVNHGILELIPYEKI